jgi:menaquinone-dependent protoporphyrinogen IX oxidase
MTKALIVSGTRCGATASTSEEIADTLRKEEFEVRVVNAKKEKAQDIAEYELVIVGSGMQIDRWTGEAEEREVMALIISHFEKLPAQAARSPRAPVITL